MICCGLVFAMVVLGGVTRLTGSGLSMVDWRPITGVLPPLTEEDWQRTFEMYQQSPEYEKVNRHMDVGDFKGIFWLEYLHRLFGRFIGIAFIIPFIIFAAIGFIDKREWPEYLLMFVLGGMQGLLGWYMVKSGLVDKPNVSQYRLTAHLLAAFLIYSYMLWVALSLITPHRPPAPRPWFRGALGATALIGVTVIYGGFVAGLKAGKIYNSFPMMGDYWVPPGVMAMEPAWRNFFENPALVQFNHRILAIMTLVLVVIASIGVRKSSPGTRASTAGAWLLAAVIAQFALGVLTLLNHVPIALAAGHQATSLLLLTAALFMLHSLRFSGTPAAEAS